MLTSREVTDSYVVDTGGIGAERISADGDVRAGDVILKRVKPDGSVTIALDVAKKSE
jgi:hypothetical protein